MAATLLSTKNLSYNGSQFNGIANDIQGNILKGHGRGHVTYLFFTFKPKKDLDAATWLRAFGLNQMTTAAKQKEQIQLFQKNQEQTFFYGLYLTASCYDYLGLNNKKPDDDPFLNGMSASQKVLEDPSVSDWEAAWQKPIHGCILIAYGGKRSELNLKTQLIKQDLALFANTFEEKGDILKNKNGDDIEHFGYVDGISQPKFFVEEIERIPTNHWNPIASWDLVLTEDGYSSYGSYWVFRKLEQNVKAFKTNEKRAAYKKGLEGEATEIVGAELVGRWENGMPRTLTTNDETIGDYTIEPSTISKINNFHYQNDTNENGIRCPYLAHIRRVNPRDESLKRIVRRGIPYGEQSIESFENPIEYGPTEGVGLLFQCFQSDIKTQFEAIQIAANKRDAEGKNDAIIGCPSQNTFVKLKGGSYFFAPSRLFFKSLNPISSLQRSIIDMNSSIEDGTIGTVSKGKSTIPIYYAHIVSNLILKQLREDIETIVDAQLKESSHSGTRNQVINILTSSDSNLKDLQQKVAKIHAWYKETHQDAPTILEQTGLRAGGLFHFEPNDKHKEKYPNHTHDKDGKVQGRELVVCGDGLCCAAEANQNASYIMIPASTTLDGGVLENKTSDGLWHIYEADKGTSLIYNIDGEDFSFTA